MRTLMAADDSDPRQEMAGALGRFKEQREQHANQPSGCCEAVVRGGAAGIPGRFNQLRRYEVLMIRRTGAHGAGTWSFPGGWMIAGESSIETVCRAIKEEVGLDVLHVRQGGYTEDWDMESGIHSVTIWHHVLVRPNQEPVIMEPDKIIDIRWVDPAQALPSPLFLPVKNFLAAGNRI